MKRGTRGYVTVRGDASLTWFEIDEAGTGISCPLADGDSRSLEDCRFELPEEPTQLDISRGEREEALVLPDGQPVLDENGEPRTVLREFDLIVVAHVEDGLISAITVVESQASAAPIFSIASAALLDVPSSVARRSGEHFYATGRVATSLVAFRPAIGSDARVLGIYLEDLIYVPTPYTSYEGRSLLFSEDGDRLYMTNQSPNSMLVFDTSEGDNDSVSGRQNRVIEEIDMPVNSDRMIWVEMPGYNPLIYVSSFTDDLVTIVDPSIPAIVGKARVGAGPYDLAVDIESARVYVSNFGDNSLSVLDISDPLAPVEIQVIGEE